MVDRNLGTGCFSVSLKSRSSDEYQELSRVITRECTLCRRLPLCNFTVRYPPSHWYEAARRRIVCLERSSAGVYESIHCALLLGWFAMCWTVTGSLVLRKTTKAIASRLIRKEGASFQVLPLHVFTMHQPHQLMQGRAYWVGWIDCDYTRPKIIEKPKAVHYRKR